MSDSRIVVVTGVTRGLGRAMVDQFIARGHVVIGCARSAEAVRELATAHADCHDFSHVDVSREPQVASWAQRVLERFAAPDLVVNNAAVINTPAPLWDVTTADFAEVVDVNIKGVFHVIRHFLPAMLQRGRGVIVNFSSGWGRSTSPEVAPYCCSKWAVEGLTRALADELPSGLAAIPLNPGIIDTDMLRICFGSDAAAYPAAEAWARTAVPFLLELGADDNGKPLSVPA